MGAATPPDLALSDHFVFSSMGQEHFDCYEEVENWLSDWFSLKDEQFYSLGIHKLPERCSKCIESNGAYFE